MSVHSERLGVGSHQKYIKTWSFESALLTYLQVSKNLYFVRTHQLMCRKP
jgi:hypothetical protein